MDHVNGLLLNHPSPEASGENRAQFGWDSSPSRCCHTWSGRKGKLQSEIPPNSKLESWGECRGHGRKRQKCIAALQASS